MAKTFLPGPKGTQQKHTIPREDLREPDGRSSCRGNLVSGHSTAILETCCPRGTGAGSTVLARRMLARERQGQEPSVGKEAHKLRDHQ